MIRLFLLIGLSLLMLGCATRKSITPSTFDLPTHVPVRAGVLIDTLIANKYHAEHNTWMREVFSGAFGEVTMVQDMQEAREKGVDFVLVVDYEMDHQGSVMHAEAAVRAYRADHRELFNDSNKVSALNWWSLQNDYRNVAIKAFTPILNNLAERLQFAENASAYGTYQVASEASHETPDSLRKVIALTDFTVTGVDMALAENLNRYMQTALFRTNRYILANRSELRKVMEEFALQESGFCDETKCYSQIGQAVGADYLLVGNVGKVGETYQITIKLINVAFITDDFVDTRLCRSCAEDGLFDEIESLVSGMVQQEL